MKIIQNRRHYVPYITQDIKSLMDQRDQLKMRAKNERDEAVSCNLYKQYKEKRNQVTDKLRNAEEVYYQKKLSNVGATIGEVWQNVYQVLGNGLSDITLG